MKVPGAYLAKCYVIASTYTIRYVAMLRFAYDGEEPVVGAVGVGVEMMLVWTVWWRSSLIDAGWLGLGVAAFGMTPG